MEHADAVLAFADAHRSQFALAVVAFLLMFVGTLAIVGFLLVRMPADYLESAEDPPFWPGRPGWLRMAARVGKNLLGVLLVALGLILSIPGIPGQGVLTILIGIMLLDIPGKRRFERRLIARRRVLAAVNSLRARFRRPPIIVRPAPAGLR